MCLSNFSLHSSTFLQAIPPLSHPLAPYTLFWLRQASQSQFILLPPNYRLGIQLYSSLKIQVSSIYHIQNTSFYSPVEKYWSHSYFDRPWCFLALSIWPNLVHSARRAANWCTTCPLSAMQAQMFTLTLLSSLACHVLIVCHTSELIGTDMDTISLPISLAHACHVINTSAL